MIAISIASNEEWSSFKQEFNKSITCCKSPFGEYFILDETLYYQSGTRKTLASAAAQWAIDHFDIMHLFVLGTCAGINDKHSELQLFQFNQCYQSDVILKEMFQYQCTKITGPSCLDILNFLAQGKISTQDKPIILLEDKEILKQEGMNCADMESAAVALIAQINHIPCTVIKGISDFPKGLDAFPSQDDTYSKNTKLIMKKIVNDILPLIQSIF